MKITLCGSTKFKDEFTMINTKLTLAGHIVYSVASFIHSEENTITEEQKKKLDLIHLKKINESDAIVVLNVDNYIGESTGKEIEWAKINDKIIFYLENIAAGTKNMKDIQNVW